jgi:hypothetical protein
MPGRNDSPGEAPLAEAAHVRVKGFGLLHVADVPALGMTMSLAPGMAPAELLGRR